MNDPYISPQPQAAVVQKPDNKLLVYNNSEPDHPLIDTSTMAHAYKRARRKRGRGGKPFFCDVPGMHCPYERNSLLFI